MIVAITGGTGFIGKRLVLRHLALGDEVRVLSRRPAHLLRIPDAVRVYYGDLTTCKVSDLFPFVESVEVLYHCAAEIVNQVRMFALHVSGTKKLLAAASGKIAHWVQLSSVGVYGSPYNEIVTEETLLTPVNIYEITKTESDKIVIEKASRVNFSFSVLRPSNVFGPGMVNRSLFQMISLIDKGLFFFVGKPGSSANYIHVDNVIKGLILCGKNLAAKNQIYNLSDYRTLEEFVEIIAEALGRSVPKFRLPKKPIRIAAKLLAKFPGVPLTESRVQAMTNRTVYATTRIEKELGYTHNISMEEGLRELVKVWKRRK